MSGAGAPKLNIDASDLQVAVLVTSWHTNITDGLLAGAEKALKDYGEKVTEDIRKNVQEKIDALKTARAGTDTAAITAAADALSTAMSAIGEAMAKEKPAEPAQPTDNGQTPPESDAGAAQ